MFENYVISGREYVPYEKNVTINQHKAPTDESIKLYGEMEDKAYKSLIEFVEVSGNNQIKISGYVYKDWSDGQVFFIYKTIVNGKEILDKVRIADGFQGDSYDLKMQALCCAYKHIAEKLTESFINELSRDRVEMGKIK